MPSMLYSEEIAHSLLLKKKSKENEHQKNLASCLKMMNFPLHIHTLVFVPNASTSSL
jgi:hypothetical protein